MFRTTKLVFCKIPVTCKYCYNILLNQTQFNLFKIFIKENFTINEGNLSSINLEELKNFESLIKNNTEDIISLLYKIKEYQCCGCSLICSTSQKCFYCKDCSKIYCDECSKYLIENQLSCDH